MASNYVNENILRVIVVRIRKDGGDECPVCQFQREELVSTG